MSHFALEKDINNALRMDGPITVGPVPRWQRKALENSTSSVNNSLNASQSLTSSLSQSALNISSNQNVTSNNKTPKNTPGKSKSTPGRAKTPKTPGNSGDRFIPNRSGMQFEIGHYMLTRDQKSEDEKMSPNKQEYHKSMSENIAGDLSNFRILSYQNKAPPAPEGHANNLRVIYSSSKAPASTRKTARYIPQVPERILDAPEIVDDYYLNLIDWSAHNHLAVALAGHVYLWNAGSGEIQQLLEMEESNEYITSVSWIKEGNYLAVGTSTAEVQLWDVEVPKRVRIMRSHSARVGSLTWNAYILSSGCRSGAIHHHDVRVANHHVGSLLSHCQEVCGLKWSPDGRYLASGGNDNILNVWPASIGQSDIQPIYSFTQHQAAVKAVSWCPWQPHILASGGGTADRSIRFWNSNLGSCLNTVDTKSQVCSILWSSHYKEIISGHGYANNELIIWKYPNMAKVAELTGHTARVLHLSMSPDGTTVVSAGADETLRLWKCFAVDSITKKKDTSSGQRSTGPMLLSIR
ncbi:cell division cycle protein 20 homolog [Limulus polyphemus]|uniref:Cell division cycle protein 20 homolog n=1 Tax=Limulus polyphemus TaxID=6850 RepID=A0ABM1BK97_LIMPO|nr:cell division cycle protein 20 homolog [Limulus polyphemus]XP_022251737.1 cell division cycle protein 20 homolog [Limulus polyphemus]XP_022251738.1 cell division cycle protein 20 homolog [Limulus polyphemus]